MESQAKKSPTYTLGKIATDNFRVEEESSLDNYSLETEETFITKINIEVDYALLELIRSHARDKGMNQREAVLDALQHFFEEHKPSDRPREVIEREKKKMREDKRRKLKV